MTQAEVPTVEIANLEPQLGPVVGKSSSGPSPAMVTAVLAVSAVALFSLLNARRSAAETVSLVTPAPGAVASAPETLQMPPEALSAAPPPAQVAPPPPPPPPPPAARAYSQPRPDPTQRRGAPTLIVDLSAPGQAPAGVGAGAAVVAQGPAAQALANTPEAFAARLSAGGGEDAAMAGPSIRDLGAVIPQGAIIPAVLETAINSDLPGYTRAVVSRDVRSFDGRVVLIPRGSRLVGQYKSAVAIGQSRAFVIWTRVIRPDGVAVDIASPGADALGRGGLEGEVDRHFFSRFGGSILLSILNAGVASIGGTPATQIAIGSPGAANAAASAVQGDQIPPTVKVPQGEAIRIFVARDLDFSAVGAMR